MKKYLLLFAVTAAFAACGGGNQQPQQAPGAVAATISPEAKQGLDLITKNDCRTCHKDNEKLIGPAYKDVANKYTPNDSTINYLADKIIKGGTGVWGNVPMTPHPTVTKVDIETMLKYVFSLKTN